MGLLAFQNCGSKSFSARTNTTQSVDDGSESSQNEPSSPLDPVGGPPATPLGSSTDAEIDGHIDTQPGGPVTFSGCQSFQELSGSSIAVPARTAEGICYYLRLMTARG